MTANVFTAVVFLFCFVFCFCFVFVLFCFCYEKLKPFAWNMHDTEFFLFILFFLSKEYTSVVVPTGSMSTCNTVTISCVMAEQLVNIYANHSCYMNTLLNVQQTVDFNNFPRLRFICWHHCLLAFWSSTGLALARTRAGACSWAARGCWPLVTAEAAGEYWRDGVRGGVRRSSTYVYNVTSIEKWSLDNEETS